MTGIISIATATLALATLSVPAPVHVQGAVKNPGPVVVQSASSLKSAVELAGGFRADADLRAVEVSGPNGTKRSWDLYALGLIPTVQPGDTVTVPTLDPMAVVFVDGRIQNRAPLDFREGMTLADVLLLAQPAKSKDVDRVIVARTTSSGIAKTTYKVDQLALVAPTIAMMPGDRVSVPFAPSMATSDRELITILIVALILIAIVK